VLALLTLAGCSDGPYAGTGSGGRGGASDTGGTGGIGGSTSGTGGAGGGGAGGTGGSDTGGGGGGAGDGMGTAGSIGGSIGPGIGGSVGGQAGVGVTLQPWPTSDAVVAVDSTNQFTSNLSDLVYQAPAGGMGEVLWGLRNDPSTLYCLLWNGTTWSGMTEDGWTNGKTLRYPSGLGSPDAEGLTRAELSSSAIYVATERDNTAGTVSRMSVLRYDYYGTAGTTLTATHEWNLTADLPASGANAGLEALTWIPDSYLVATGFFDQAANAIYDPARYPDHGTGLFFVGHEGSGMILGYALDHSAGAFTRVAMVPSGNTSVMALYFDRDIGNLWTYCDNTCANHASVLRMSSGHFTLQYLFNRPATLSNSNFEGIAIAPESECVQGKKSFFWSDDSNAGGHAIYRGSIPCGQLP
jgi:hypothetical protein